MNAHEITINAVELASELASAHLERVHYNLIQIWEDYDEDGNSKYTEEAQDIFNDLYDEYYTLIESTKMTEGVIVTLYDDYDKDAGYIIEKGNEYWTGKNWSDIKAYAESYKTKKEAKQKLKSTKI